MGEAAVAKPLPPEHCRQTVRVVVDVAADAVDENGAPVSQGEILRQELTLQLIDPAASPCEEPQRGRVQVLTGGR
ncbi:hypothetical protein GCM10022275_07210 [Tessaracoccus defluvii]